MSIAVTNYGIPLTVDVDSEEGLTAYIRDMHAAGVDGKDIRLLPLMLEAARTAESEEYCYQYDRISEQIGSWTRDELRNAGLLTSDFVVRGTRQITMTVTVPWAVTVTATRPADIRNGDVDLDIDISEYDIRQAISNGDWTEDDTSDDIDEVERD